MVTGVRTEQQVRAAPIIAGWVQSSYPGGGEDQDEWYGSGGSVFRNAPLAPATSRGERILRGAAWVVGFLMAIL